jgi:hypothetical protein
VRTHPWCPPAVAGPSQTLAIVFSSVGLASSLAVGTGTAVVAESISGDRYADGTVVDLLGSSNYRAVVEFTAPSGAAIAR